jgi:hypothetical protein
MTIAAEHAYQAIRELSLWAPAGAQPLAPAM